MINNFEANVFASNKDIYVQRSLRAGSPIYCVVVGLSFILYLIGFLRNMISRCWEATEFSIKIARNEIVNQN